MLTWLQQYSYMLSCRPFLPQYRQTHVLWSLVTCLLIFNCYLNFPSNLLRCTEFWNCWNLVLQNLSPSLDAIFDTPFVYHMRVFIQLLSWWQVQNCSMTLQMWDKWQIWQTWMRKEKVLAWQNGRKSSR